MARYHINPGTGKPGQCSAKSGNCPFASDSEHYPSVEAAQAAYEAQQASSTVPAGARKAKTQPEFETVVPAPEFEQYAGLAKGADVKVGDAIQVRGGTAEVLGVKTGYKYNTVTIPDATKGTRTVNLPLDEERPTWIRRETEVSKIHRTAMEKERYYEVSLKTYAPRRAEAVTAIQETVDKGYLLNSGQLDSLVEAEAQDAVVKRYEALVEQAKRGAENLPNYRPYTRAADALAEEFEREVMAAASSGNNVSTSEARNLYERAMTSAKAAFVKNRNFHW